MIFTAHLSLLTRVVCQAGEQILVISDGHVAAFPFQQHSDATPSNKVKTYMQIHLIQYRLVGYSTDRHRFLHYCLAFSWKFVFICELVADHARCLEPRVVNF